MKTLNLLIALAEKMQIKIKSKTFYISTFYKCFSLKNLEKLEIIFRKELKKRKIIGTLILSPEGINSTIASKSKSSLEQGIQFIEQFTGNLVTKNSLSNKQPFKRLKIKKREEIVPSGLDLKLNNHQGKYVEPNDWQEFISQKDVFTIDVRNDYEIEVGTFKNSLSPKTKNFREFNKFIKKNKEKLSKKKLAIFCTGGIRCEKASVLFEKNGLKDVHQLNGGILNFFEKVEDKEKWGGECFVFDERVTVKTNLEPGNYIQCYACRRPLSQKDLLKKEYVKGISCHKCLNEKSHEDRTRYAERQKQINSSL